MRKIGLMLLAFIVGAADGFLWTMSYYNGGVKSDFFASALSLTLIIFIALGVIMAFFLELIE